MFGRSSFVKPQARLCQLPSLEFVALRDLFSYRIGRRKKNVRCTRKTNSSSFFFSLLSSFVVFDQSPALTNASKCLQGWRMTLSWLGTPEEGPRSFQSPSGFGGVQWKDAAKYVLDHWWFPSPLTPHSLLFLCIS